jgi:RNA polymerase sigma-70 factor (ECF subfamily)
MPDFEAMPGPATGGWLTDEEVVRRVLDGDSALFEVLMRRYNQRLFRAARGIVGNDSEAEDAIQQAYVNAYFHLDQFADRARFSTWLTKIAIHEALARARRSSFTNLSKCTDLDKLAQEDLHSTLPNPEHQAFASEMSRLLEASIDTLPEAYRIVFILREIEGLSTTETGDCLDLGEDTVKTRLHRARALLREELCARVGAATADAFRFHARRCDRVVGRVFELIRLEQLASHRLPG